MARPKLGSAAKTQVGTVRLTEAQKGVLVQRYGTVSRGLRALVIKEMDIKE